MKGKVLLAKLRTGVLPDRVAPSGEDDMTAKSVGLWAVVGLLCGAAVVRGQDYTPSTGMITTEPAAQTVLPPPGPPVIPDGGPPIPCLSPWILGTKPSCCGPIGGCGPIDM